nr:MAG TPA: hypothetical protein [Caudoviricetes sp.]
MLAFTIFSPFHISNFLGYLYNKVHSVTCQVIFVTFY